MQTSVPPDIEEICTCSPTASAIHANCSGASGEPVEPSVRTPDRSCCLPGVMPAFWHDSTQGAPTPNTATPWRSTSRPQDVEVGMARAAVVEDHRRAHQQAADQEVPHHPAGGGEPQEPVARAEVVVQRQRLEVLDDDPAVRLHDALGQPGRPRRVQHPQRVVEGHRRELQRGGGGGELRPRHRAVQRGVGVEVRHQHRGLQRRQRLLQAGDALARRRTLGRCSGSRRPRPAPWARSGRSGRAPHGRRSPASTTTTPHPARPWPGRPPASRPSSGPSRRPGRPARPRPPSVRRGRGRRGRAAPRA